MLTSRFQLGLIASLAVGLGFSLASSQAIGYPAGAISMGMNPLWSTGGNLVAGSTDIVTAPADQDVVVSDLILTYGCINCGPRVSLYVDGTNVASFRYYQQKDYYDDAFQSPHPIQHAFKSGVHVPAGSTLSMSIDSFDVDYTLSGYYAQP
jgi:hypothetical protein